MPLIAQHTPRSIPEPSFLFANTSRRPRTTLPSKSPTKPRPHSMQSRVPLSGRDLYDSFELDLRPATQFRLMFERGDIPVKVTTAAKTTMKWKIPLSQIDVNKFLPIFIEGMIEQTPPFNFVAYHGTKDLINHLGKFHDIFPTIVLPIKKLLDCREEETIKKGMEIVKLMINLDEKLGIEIVPFFRTLLAGLAVFANTKELAGEIEDFLRFLERNGGEEAFVNIKYMIPSYDEVTI
jgi:Parkin co-regulated protein